MSAPRFVVVATWECDQESDAYTLENHIRERIADDAEVQVLKFDGERLTGVTPDISDSPPGRPRKYAALEAALRLLPTTLAHGSGDEKWQERVHSTIDNERRLFVAANDAVQHLQEEYGSKVPATYPFFDKLSQLIANRLTAPGEERVNVSVDQPTAAHKVARQVRIRALGVAIVFPPDPVRR